MLIMVYSVYSLLWVMQGLYHQPYEACLNSLGTESLVPLALARRSFLRAGAAFRARLRAATAPAVPKANMASVAE